MTDYALAHAGPATDPPASLDNSRHRAERRRTPPPWLFALGRADLPESVVVAGQTFRRARVFKHDFFAATGLYESDDRRAVVKFGRAASLLGFPLAWLGRRMVDHEARIYERVDGLTGIPAYLGRVTPCGFAHEFAEGRDLRRDDHPNDDFFPSLERLMHAIHQRDVAYVDLEKRENVLLGDDQCPHLIDFQISWHWPDNSGGRTALARRVLAVLQASDRYHLYKHWRRHRPDQLTPEQLAMAQPPPWIAWHRALFRPITLARRRILEWLGARSRGQVGRSEEARQNQ